MYTSGYNESALYVVRYSCGCETQFGLVYDKGRSCMMFGVSKELECVEGKDADSKCVKGREVGYVTKRVSDAETKKA